LQPKTSIQAELAAFLKREGRTINQFSGASGVNSGTLSSIINGNRPIAMQQLDRITAGMGLPEGAFYELYIDECVVHSTPDWRRLGPFLHRCAELDRLECIRQVVQIMMDNITYAPVLFETAEEFYRQGRHQAAALLYEGVADSEKYQHSERLALCQYRLFTIAAGRNPDADFRAATRFEYFVERLDDSDQLGALQQLADVYVSLRNWDKVQILAEELGHKAGIQYQNKHHKSRKQEELKGAPQPLCFYILYSYWLQSLVCDERGDYERALHYVSLYSGLDWVLEDSEEVRQIKEQFRKLGAANTYLYRLMCGDLEVLSDYLAHIGTGEVEILPGLLRIMEAANRYHWNVDAAIDRFVPRLVQEWAAAGRGSIEPAAEQYPVLLYELAVYSLGAEDAEQGFRYLLQSLDVSAELGSDGSVIRCVRLFEQYREFASEADQENYKRLISRVQAVIAGRSRANAMKR
jgi:transcriptional regulator with XRE-family HTH domain